MMNPQKQITTNAPSIRYEGDLRAEQAGIMQKHAQAMQQMQQQAMMQQQQGMMQPQMGQPQMGQPQMPQPQPQPQMGQPQMPQGIMQAQGRMPAGRMPAAYGGIMGDDGRKQYGIGSWFQEKIMDPIKNNKALAATAAAIAADYGFNDGAATKASGKFIRDIFKGQEEVLRNPETNEAIIENGKTVMVRKGGVGGDIMGGLAKSLIPATGGLVAGMFSDKLNPPDEEGNIDYGASMGIKNIGQAANLLDQKQGLEAGLRFLPKKEAREFSPEEMAIQYGTAEAPAIANLAEGGISQMGIPDYGQQMMDPNMMEQIRRMVEGMQAQGMGREEMEQAVRMQVPDMSADMSMGFAEGGPLGEMGTVMEEGEEMLDMNGMEKDYREDGGFVPIGEYEKKDDVPARLSVNEFVFTADAVRGAGDGDVDKGAERLQGIMKQLEQQGRPEGMEMLDVSERLSEVV
jgi:hypothetical protein